MMEASLGFLSAGCNRVANTAAWCHSSGVVAFGCGPLVALCDPLLGCCFATLKGHAGRVNSLSWVDSQTLLSGDSLGVLCVWRARS